MAATVPASLQRAMPSIWSRQSATPSVTVAVDVYHVWWDLGLAEQLQRLGGHRIAGYHLCDWLADTTDVLLDRGMMGDGVADLKHIFEAVEGAGYHGYCEVEIFSANNWSQRDPNEVLDICLDASNSSAEAFVISVPLSRPSSPR